MKSYQFMLLAAILVVSAFAGYTNTTSFWQTQLNETQMHFQVYSGNSILYDSGYEEIDWYHAKDTSGMFYNLFSAMGHTIDK